MREQLLRIDILSETEREKCRLDIRQYFIIKSTEEINPIPPPPAEIISGVSISAIVPVRGEEGGGGDSAQSPPPLNEKILKVDKINENGKAEKIGDELSLANLEKEETVSRPVLEDFISASGPVRGEEGGGRLCPEPPP